MSGLENYVLILVIQQITRLFCCRECLLRLDFNTGFFFICFFYQPRGFCLFRISFFLSLYFLKPTQGLSQFFAVKVSFKPEEFLSVHLIEFTDDVFDGALETRYYDVLDSIHTPICGPNDFVQNREGSLERCELN